MKLRGGNMTHLIVAVMFLLKLCSSEVEGRLTCRRQQNSNGTFSFFVSVDKTCEDYSWKVKGTAVAYDRVSKKTLVQNHGPTYIVFKSCQTDVTYFCDRGTTITCERSCPTQSGHESHQEEHDADTTATKPRNIHEEAKPWLFPSILLAVIVTVIGR